MSAALDDGCAWCSRVSPDLIVEGDDLVCPPGRGCARKPAQVGQPAKRKRRKPVRATALPPPVHATAAIVWAHSRDCRCGACPAVERPALRKAGAR